MKQPTLPTATLFAWLDRTLPGASDGELATFLRCHRASICRWKRQGTITLWVADRIAIAAGSHPAEIWGAAYTAIPIDERLVHNVRERDELDKRSHRKADLDRQTCTA